MKMSKNFIFTSAGKTRNCSIKLKHMSTNHPRFIRLTDKRLFFKLIFVKIDHVGNAYCCIKIFFGERANSKML